MKLILWKKTGFTPGTFSIVTLALVLVSGCVVEPNGQVVFQPVVVAAPPPVVVVAVPDDYIWDGYEYVGLVGAVYFYLGPGNVWLRCEPWRLDRFNGWERNHPDWHTHAIPNEHYRRDAQGHEHPSHEDHGHGHDDQH